jgi:hypothetical protein
MQVGTAVLSHMHPQSLDSWNDSNHKKSSLDLAATDLKICVQWLDTEDKVDSKYRCRSTTLNVVTLKTPIDSANIAAVEVADTDMPIGGHMSCECNILQ